MEINKLQNGEDACKIWGNLEKALKGKSVRLERNGHAIEGKLRCAMAMPSDNDCQYVALGWDDTPAVTYLTPKEVGDLLLTGECTTEGNDHLKMLDEAGVEKNGSTATYFTPPEIRKYLLDEQEPQRGKGLTPGRCYCTPPSLNAISSLLGNGKPEETPSSLVGKMVRVDFYDHFTLRGWYEINSIDGTPDQCTTIGRVVAENDLALVLASTIVADDGKNGEGACDPICIVRGAIKEIREINIEAI